uniref:ABC transporter ATP-binding protein n=1 Tax=Eubacterium cellulosolvens TaxID=29322 RepID=UPI0009DFE33D|nr:ABC transporter ATP-binding protein [[Eubacterium] cellulosolvens]
MIEVKNTSFRYAGTDADCLRDINLRVKAGECILFCGKSGCGKSTILRLFNGMIPNFFDGEQQGTVTFRGELLSDMPLFRIAQSFGTVFQNPRTQFYTVNTTSEIAFGLENMGTPREQIRKRVEQTAKELEIEYLMDRSIFELSGGEKQIIAFASVYAMDPEVYLLDEPSANLDFAAVEKIRKILRLLKSRGKTILISEHRIYYLKDILDRALYMEDGRILREYSEAELGSMPYEEHEKTGLRMLNLAEMPYGGRRIRRRPEECFLTYFSGYHGKKKCLEISRAGFAPGKIYAVIGNNGAGKSTFLSAFSGVMRKTGGYVIEQNAVSDRRKRLKNSYIVMQEVNHQLFMDSVEKEITTGKHRMDPDGCGRLLSELDLEGLEDRHPMTLSGGQKQRVIIASARYSGKRFLFFDEPTSGLDFYHMIRVSELLKEISGDETYIFVVTHDYEFILSCCDAVVHIESGEMVEQYDLDQGGLEKIRTWFLAEPQPGIPVPRQSDEVPAVPAHGW